MRRNQKRRIEREEMKYDEMKCDEEKRDKVQICCRDLSLGYGTRVIAEGLSFTVREGDYLCIAGENGAGKTTLMKVLLGLERPMRGTVEFGCGVTRKDIGYLPQQRETRTDFPASVWEVVLSGCLARSGWRPFYCAAEKQLARENMEKMGVSGLARESYQKLSGGQQQRVLLARALCAARKLLLLDEPISGLDPKASVELYRMTRQLNREGITIIMISHDLNSSLDDAGQVLYLGREPFFGAKETFCSSRIGRQLLRKEGE